MIAISSRVNLLSYVNKKTIKGEKLGYLTGIMYLAPAELAIASGSLSTACPFASNECKALCLFSSGFGVYNRVKKARMAKTTFLMGNKKWHELPSQHGLLALKKNIKSLIKRSKKSRMIPTIRLNGTSDYRVHTWGLMQEFKDIQFYDYTKDASRMFDYLRNKLPKNYHLTFSFSGNNWELCESVLKQGGNVACVFAKKIPKTYKGFTVVNGDKTDLRFLDKKNSIVGLLPKGKARSNLQSSFIIKDHLK